MIIYSESRTKLMCSGMSDNACVATDVKHLPMKADGGIRGMGWRFDYLCWPWGGACEWSRPPGWGDWHGPYSFRQTKFKDFSRQITIFQGLSFSDTLLNTYWPQHSMESLTILLFRQGWSQYFVLISITLCKTAKAMGWLAVTSEVKTTHLK